MIKNLLVEESRVLWRPRVLSVLPINMGHPKAHVVPKHPFEVAREACMELHVSVGKKHLFLTRCDSLEETPPHIPTDQDAIIADRFCELFDVPVEESLSVDIVDDVFDRGLCFVLDHESVFCHDDGYPSRGGVVLVYMS